MKLAIGNDHVCLALKKVVVFHLEARGIELLDAGTNSDERFDYPISGYKVGKWVAEGKVDGGVLLCGTGVGISLAANKVRGVRACVCSEPYTARLAKEHNNANIIAIGGRVVGEEMAKCIIDAWLDATFEGGRHQDRVDMINQIDKTGELEGIL
jgi:ribose 5-phosphate isomerase B